MKDNRFVIGGVLSGAFGKADQMTQMLAAPVAVTDHKDQIIRVPIMKSFAEGHDIASYWSTLPGSRKGLMQKGLGTRDVGALSKRLVNTTIDQTITKTDCETTDGLVFPIDSRELLDRVVADGPFKGKTVTPELVQKLRTRKVSVIKARSPLKCKENRGVCQYCYGLDETGQFPPLGFHIGALVGQTASEPVLQTMLRGFHTGGAVGRSAVGFDRIEQIFEMPENVLGKATLSSIAGTVKSVTKGLGGGWNVTVGDDEHFVPKETGLAVKKGDKVVAGQKLSSTGVIKSQELLSITGDIDKVRGQILSDLQKEYSSGGIRMKQKIFETVIKPMTDRAEVTDAGDGEKLHVYRGDIVSINTIEELNKKIGKGKKILYRPTLLPIRISPYHGDDLFGKLMFERLHETLQKAPSTLEKADSAKGHPITRAVFGGYKKP
jgi:DNA-directed RNA polymerase subunit beta'